MMLPLAFFVFATILLETNAALTPLILSNYRPRHVLEEDQYDPSFDSYETPRGVASHRENYRAKPKAPHQVSPENSNFASDDQQYRSLVNLLNGLKYAYLVRHGGSVRIHRISNPDVLREYRERHSDDGSIGGLGTNRACQCGLDRDQELDGVGFKERLRLVREGRSECNCKKNMLDLTLRSLLTAGRRANEESVRYKSDKLKDNPDFGTAISDDTPLLKNRNDRDEKDKNGRYPREGRDIRDGRDFRDGRDVKDGRDFKEGRGIREGRHERAHAFKDYKDSGPKLHKADKVDKKSNVNKGTDIGWDYDAAPKKAKDRFDDYDQPKKPRQKFNNFETPKKLKQNSDNFDAPTKLKKKFDDFDTGKKLKQTFDTYGAPKKMKPLEKVPHKFSPTTMDWRQLVKQEKAKNSRSHFNAEPVLPSKGTANEWGPYKNLKISANDEWAKVGVKSAAKPVRPRPIRYHSAENAQAQLGGSYGGGGRGRGGGGGGYGGGGGGGFGRTSIPMPGKKRLYDDEN